MARFPCWPTPLRTCCKFHENEAQAGGDCRTPAFGYSTVYAHYLVYRLDWDNMVATYDHMVPWEGMGGYLTGYIHCENYGEGSLVAKGPAKFSIDKDHPQIGVMLGTVVAS